MGFKGFDKVKEHYKAKADQTKPKQFKANADMRSETFRSGAGTSMSNTDTEDTSSVQATS